MVKKFVIVTTVNDINIVPHKQRSDINTRPIYVIAVISPKPTKRKS